MPMKATIPAITPSSFKAMVSQWGRVARYRESASIWYYNKSDLLWRFRNLTDDKKLYKKYFVKRSIHVVDMETELVDDPDEFFATLDKKSKSNRDNVFFIVGVDKELLAGNTSLFATITNRDAWVGRGSYLLFFTIDFTHPQFRTLFGPVSTSIQNTIIHPMHAPADTIQYIRHQSETWGFSIPDALAQHIQAHCGGHFLLVKEAVRYLRDHPKASLPDVLTHSQMRWRMEMIWQHFLPTEQSVLRHIVNHTAPTSDEERHSLSFLTSAGYIQPGKKPHLTIPLLVQLVKGHSPLPLLELGQNRRIFANGICIEESLPRKERILLRHFLENPETVISRTVISNLIDGNGNYSDWAIDQLTYRLRNSLARLNLSPSVIQTVYGKGFRYEK